MKQDQRFILNAELRAKRGAEGDEDALVIAGRAIKYNSLSEPNVPMAGCKEQIAPGCFADSIRSGDIMADYNHDNSGLPLGRTSNGSLQLHDSAQGLDFELKLNPQISFHRDLHSAVASSLIHDCSFGFIADDDQWDAVANDNDRCFNIRTVKHGKLFAISLVGRPAYGATNATARSQAYSFGAPARPQMSDAEMRKRAAYLGDLIACDLAEMYGGFHEVRIGPRPEDVTFTPFGPGDLDRYYRREAERLGRIIHKDDELRRTVAEVCGEAKRFLKGVKQ